jgi:predicted Zn-dependent peptidase
VEKQTKPALKIKFKKTDQAHLSLGVRTYPVGHKDEFIIKLMSIILGGSMSSRLFIELRERRGLCYYVRAQTEFYSDSGYLAARAGVPMPKLNEAARVIVDEFRKLTSTLVEKDELTRAKDLLKGQLAIQLEASDNLSNWYAHQAIARPKLLTPEQFLKIMEKIKPADIRRVARNIFRNERLNLAVIGDIKNTKPLTKILKF